MTDFPPEQTLLPIAAEASSQAPRKSRRSKTMHRQTSTQLSQLDLPLAPAEASGRPARRTRAEMVQRGRVLKACVDYPPQEDGEKLAALLLGDLGLL